MAGALRLGGRTFAPGELVVMAIVNRTPDSFFDRGATFAADSALRAVERAVDEGAEIIDIGGVKAGPGAEVDVAEEIRRTVDTIAAVRAAFPEVVISIDTWRAEVAVEAVAAGADLLNDTWAGRRPGAGPRWPPRPAPGWSARTPAGSPRGPGRTGPPSTTWSPTWSRR